MKDKEQRTRPEIIPVSDDICLWEFWDEPEDTGAEKIHPYRECDADGQVNKEEEVEETLCGPISFPFPQPHGFGHQYRHIDIIDEPGEQKHGAKNKEINVGLDIAAEIPGDDDGHQEEDPLGKDIE